MRVDGRIVVIEDGRSLAVLHVVGGVRADPEHLQPPALLLADTRQRAHVGRTAAQTVPQRNCNSGRGEGDGQILRITH